MKHTARGVITLQKPAARWELLVVLAGVTFGISCGSSGDGQRSSGADGGPDAAPGETDGGTATNDPDASAREHEAGAGSIGDLRDASSGPGGDLRDASSGPGGDLRDASSGPGGNLRDAGSGDAGGQVARADGGIVAECVSSDVADWWPAGSSWRVRQRLTFRNSAQPEALLSFPVMVKLTPNSFNYALSKPDGTDLRFIDADNTELKYHIEDWHPGGNSHLWVNVPRIDASPDRDHIWMYYGHAQGEDVQDVAGTYDASYAMVLHLSETTKTAGAFNDHRDATAFGNHAEALITPVDGMFADGRVGGADRFDGTDDALSVRASASIANVFSGGGTISAWIRPRSWGGEGFGRILDKATSYDATLGWELQVDGNTGLPGTRTLLFEAGFSDHYGGWACPVDAIALSTWQHVALVFNSDSPSNDPVFYINGQKQEVTEYETPAGTWVADTAVDLTVGSFSPGDSIVFDGIIDEVQVSNVARSAVWVRASYASMQDAFVVFGRPESICP